MTLFRYRAVDPTGAVSEDVIEAPDREAVINRLRAGDRLPVRVEPVPAGESPAVPSATGPTHRRRLWDRRAGGADVAIFARQFATLLDAGLPADRALAVMARATENAAMGAVVADLGGRLRDGAGLSEAMGAHPKVFDGFHRAMARAGEEGGMLGRSLGDLADYLERADHVAAAVRTALVYPAILVFASIASLVVLMTLVIPQFDLLFRQSAGDLPALTRGVLAVSQALRDHGWVLAAGLAVSWLALRLAWRGAAARERRDRVLIGLPVAGRLIVGVEVERLARTLAALLANGVGLPRALALAGGALGNRALARAVARTIPRVEQGRRLADAMAAEKLFPPLAVQMVRVGEEGGRLGAILEKLAETYARQTEATLKRLLAAIEPALILLIGLFVGIVVLSLMSAIVGINALAF